MNINWELFVGSVEEDVESVHVKGSGLIVVLTLAIPISFAVRFPITHCGRLYWFKGHSAASHPTSWAFDDHAKNARMTSAASRGTKGEDLIECMLTDTAERVLCGMESQVKNAGKY